MPGEQWRASKGAEAHRVAQEVRSEHLAGLPSTASRQGGLGRGQDPWYAGVGALEAVPRQQENVTMGDARESNDTGVEAEETGFEVTKPFDPNKVRVRVWTPTVDLLMKRLKEGQIDLQPDFQRKAGIWKDEAQSRLIESLLLRIPLPAFFMGGADEDRYIVIDGIQRLTALKRCMIDKNLRLSGMEFLASFNNKRFEELPRSLQRRLEETQLTIHVIERGTPDDAKLTLFKRINTRGLVLSAQEFRHALNPDPARSFLKRLAESPEFMRATDWAVSAARMEDRECVLRFVAFVLTPPAAYDAPEFDAFLNKAMQEINKMNHESRQGLEKRFLRAMSAASEIFGKKAFRKLARAAEGGEHLWPVNKALFESWSINLDSCSDEQLQKLISQKDQLVEEFARLLSDNQDFTHALSQGTGSKSKVSLRFGEIRALVQRILA
jgi:hypothetical protein